MPVSEISKGVFIIAPRDLPKYKDTAAGQYTSVFTKQRADQWEMAQKQAMLNVELGTKRYAEEMKTYRDRLDALDARKKELAGLKVRVAEGRLDAKDAAELAALREAGDRQKTMAVNAAKKVERMSLSAGGESVTDTTRTGGDGGTKPAKPTTDVSSGAMTGIAKFELITRDPTGTGAEPWLDDKLTKLVNATSSSGGTIVTESAEDRVNARGSVVDRLVAGREADLRRQDPKLTEPQARAQAEKYVLDRLGAIDPAAKAEVKSYFDKVYDIQLGTPDAGGGTSTSRTVTTRPGATTTRKFPGLGDVPDAPTVAAPTVAPDTELRPPSISTSRTLIPPRPGSHVPHWAAPTSSLIPATSCVVDSVDLVEHLRLYLFSNAMLLLYSSAIRHTVSARSKHTVTSSPSNGLRLPPLHVFVRAWLKGLPPPQLRRSVAHLLHRQTRQHR